MTQVAAMHVRRGDLIRVGPRAKRRVVYCVSRMDGVVILEWSGRKPFRGVLRTGMGRHWGSSRITCRPDLLIETTLGPEWQSVQN